jgi:ADP-ribose pyrophosphatase YjhB (NUDIX family)
MALGDYCNNQMPHIHEKIDFTVEVYIVHANKVLLRIHDKHKIWLSIGGHVELNEDPIEAAYREVKEESGLVIRIIGTHLPDSGEGDKDLIPPLFLNRNRVSNSHEHVTLIYAAIAEETNIQPQDGEKETEFKWFTEEELDDISYGIKIHVRHYAKTALQLALKN